MKLLTAKVTRAPKIVETKHGQRFVLDVELNGETQAIWGPPEMMPTAKWGEYITLGRDSKNKLHLVEGENVPVTATEPTPTANHSPQTEGLTPDQKRAIAAYIGEMGDLYRYCYETAGEKLATAPNEAKQAMASSLFIAAQRKFNLT